jgi:hypothetical protein
MGGRRYGLCWKRYWEEASFSSGFAAFGFSKTFGSESGFSLLLKSRTQVEPVCAIFFPEKEITKSVLSKTLRYTAERPDTGYLAQAIDRLVPYGLVWQSKRILLENPVPLALSGPSHQDFGRKRIRDVRQKMERRALIPGPSPGGRREYAKRSGIFASACFRAD